MERVGPRSSGGTPSNRVVELEGLVGLEIEVASVERELESLEKRTPELEAPRRQTGPSVPSSPSGETLGPEPETSPNQAMELGLLRLEIEATSIERELESLERGTRELETPRRQGRAGPSVLSSRPGETLEPEPEYFDFRSELLEVRFRGSRTYRPDRASGRDLVRRLSEVQDLYPRECLVRVGKRRVGWDAEDGRPYKGKTEMVSSGLFEDLFREVREEFGLEGDSRVLTASLSFYDRGAGIAHHRDSEYPGSFILGLSFGEERRLRLKSLQRPRVLVEECEIQGGSWYLLRVEENETLSHSVSRGRGERSSITFRFVERRPGEGTLCSPLVASYGRVLAWAPCPTRSRDSDVRSPDAGGPRYTRELLLQWELLLQSRGLLPRERTRQGPYTIAGGDEFERRRRLGSANVRSGLRWRAEGLD